MMLYDMMAMVAIAYKGPPWGWSLLVPSLGGMHPIVATPSCEQHTITKDVHRARAGQLTAAHGGGVGSPLWSNSRKPMNVVIPWKGTHHGPGGR